MIQERKTPPKGGRRGENKTAEVDNRHNTCPKPPQQHPFSHTAMRCSDEREQRKPSTSR